MKRRFLYHITAVLLVVLIFSSAFFYLVCKGLQQAKQDTIGKYNYLTTDTTYYNTVFFGASTVHLGINPPLFDSITGSNSFNASLDGIGIAEISLLIEKYIASHGAPKNIFIAFNEPTLGMERSVWYFAQYYPFIKDTAFNEMVRLEPKLLLGRYAPAWAVTYFDDPLKNLALIGLLRDYRKPNYAIPAKGFERANEVMKTDVPKGNVYFVGCNRGWQLLEKTVADCAAKNIQVNFIMPPIYNSTLADTTITYIQKLHAFEPRYHTRLFNYTGDERFNAKPLFADRIHTNAAGAELLTTLLAKEFVAQPAKDSTAAFLH